MIGKFTKATLIRLTVVSTVALSVIHINPSNIYSNALIAEAANPAAYSDVFNADYYYSHNPDVAAACGHDEILLLDHFLTYGMVEGRQGNSEFNVFSYKNRYADLQAAFGDDLTKYYTHYMEYGKKEGRSCSGGTRVSSYPKTTTRANLSEQSRTNSTSTTVSANPASLNTSSFEAFVADYYGKAVFIGDSVMTGFRNYSERSSAASTHSSKFLANVGFALYNASSKVTSSSKHPTYQGNKTYVWDNVAKMDVNRAFILFGANELVSFSPDKSVSEYYIPFVHKIMESKPGIEINIISMQPIYAGTNKGHLNKQNVETYNNLLKEMCSSNGWNYVDITTYLKDANGDIIPTYSSDRYVHINYKGYEEAWEPAFTNYARDVYNKCKKPER